MIPKDKAIELYIKYIDAYNDRNLQVSDYKFAKQCALIAVDEIIEFMEVDDFDSDTCYWANHSKMQYWIEVKQEIEKL
jgi:hypothetical protein